HIAEETALAGRADGIPLKVTIGEATSMSLSMTKFSIPRLVTRNEQAVVEMTLENKGERDIVPEGEVIFYDSSGSEVAAVAINEVGTAIAAGETETIHVPIPFGDTIGRFKANATINYGTTERSSIFDTAQFFVIPIYILYGAVAFIILFSLFITYMLKRTFDEDRYEVDDEQSIPLRVATGRAFEEKEHDITISNN